MPLTYCQNGEVIKPQYVIETLHKLTKGDAIITTEVGQNQMWTAQFFQFDQSQYLYFFRWAGYDGFWTAGRHRRQMRFPR
ncbi:MAG: hypothetical protein MZV70_51045 [Desulfobacterales bacterium]|nr:hypothetical protein [Desulfobacterales bacterium]